MNLWRFFSLFLLVLTLTACAQVQSAPSVPAPQAPPVNQDASLGLAPAELGKLTAEMQAIHRQGTLKVAMYARDRYPFFYLDETGTLTGSDVMLAQDIADKFGVKVSFLRTAGNFDELIDQVASGEADFALSKLSMTLQRAQKVFFSSPYLTLRQSLLVNRLQLAKLGKQGEHTLQLIQAQGDKIGAISGSSYVQYARELFPKAQIIQFNTGPELMEAVSKGEVLAVLYDEFELSMHLKHNPGSSLDLQFIALNDKIDPLAIAVSAKHQHLLAWMNVYLELNRPFIHELLQHYEIE
ncbi:ABC transporter substrate-binding protein [Paenibacillus eucommiae]|uniref:ABC-type amino acid transport substrate-binding protein n=1 Tax=Paenibacillus eucommiae TaxID=1355755 RepID=A0ABS4IQY4_9BACL|nr:ABC transporter substrate-binding protein [Paenibacillus eucommiae]MBP1989979.1 ABC-type amino acid transport substrate-binding protein [Paenibacillus eucommiae]